MSDAQNSTVWLTQEAFDKLTDELDYLKGEGRTTVSAKIAQARDEGDLSENGGYHAAREEQGQQEARIRQLEAMLRDAKIGEAPAGSKKVAPGMTVTIAYDDDPEDTDTFLLGSRELIGARMARRKNHYMPTSLLDSQFATLEPPADDEHPITVSIEGDPSAIEAAIVAALEGR